MIKDPSMHPTASRHPPCAPTARGSHASRSGGAGHRSVSPAPAAPVAAAPVVAMDQSETRTVMSAPPEATSVNWSVSGCSAQQRTLAAPWGSGRVAANSWQKARALPGLAHGGSGAAASAPLSRVPSAGVEPVEPPARPSDFSAMSRPTIWLVSSSSWESSETREARRSFSRRRAWFSVRSERASAASGGVVGWTHPSSVVGSRPAASIAEEIAARALLSSSTSSGVEVSREDILSIIIKSVLFFPTW
mmetsp:Transcript_8009/g.18298  ORF Transcript_8009/g.18298 Transcript_8009/m.18298 type:complete len:248 (-) Transcript_8009:48-791(-)